MSKEDQERKLLQWLAGESTAADKEDLSQTSDLKSMRNWISGIDQMKPDMDFDATANWSRLEQDVALDQLTSRRMPMWLPIAASLLVLVGIFWFFAQSTEMVVTSQDQITSVNLPDQSSVELKPGSQMTYLSKGFANNRTIQLKGTGYFQVTPGSTFIVKTARGEVTVIGTSFTVRSDSVFLVRCFEGEVSVQMEGVEATNLQAGQEADDRSSGAAQGNILAEPWWIDQEFSIERGELEDVAKLLQDHFEVLIELAPEIDRQFTGYLSATDLEEALETLRLALDLRVEKDSQGVIHLLP